MALIEISQLTAIDIPSSFPEPLRRSLLEMYDQLNSIVDDLNEAAEEASSASAAGAQNSEAIDAQSTQNRDLLIRVENNENKSSKNSRSITDIKNSISRSGEDLEFIKNDYVSKSKTDFQEMASSLGVTGNLSVDGEIVVIATQQGWAAHSGQLQYGGMDSGVGYSVGAAYNQAEVEAIANGLVEVRKVVNALSSALYSHHQLIGPTVTPP